MCGTDSTAVQGSRRCDDTRRGILSPVSYTHLDVYKRQYEYYTGNKWGRAENYHLSINSGIIGTENSVSLIQSFVALIKAK